ncbi:sensor domain-containing diguanylate cyclase [Pseudothauera lacus]|uniref:Diguanylate cyclase with PAS/PAC sensor n=1 Tax=Pseudothauera lacus TaxID=2136175 RepID=A0A2T4IC60_9RHOO|nr:diguanylate cyclase [Pseudothauera lacus]PTD95362.1 hypothetical protein C8261_15225 [Pseudothauera lacus]
MHRLSFRAVAALACLALALIHTAIGTYAWQYGRDKLEDGLQREAHTLRTAFEVGLSGLEQQMLTLASLVAADPQVPELFHRGRTAVLAEGGGAGGVQAGALRKDLYQQVAPAWITLQQRYGVRQLHFQFGPGALSYLRVHTPERFGDRMDGLRHIIEDVNRDHQPRSGFETGRIYSGVRGVVPVWHTAADGRREYVGALEAGTSFDAQLQHLDEQLGAGVAVLLREQHVDKAVWDEYRNRNGLRFEKGCRCYLEASSRDEVNAWMDAGVLLPLHGDETLSQLIEWEGRHWHLTRFALRDYLGKRDPGVHEAVGSVLVWRDASAALATWRSQQRNLQLTVLAAYVLTQALLLWLLLRTRRSLQQRIDTTTAALRDSEEMLKRAQSVARLGCWHYVPAEDRLIWSEEIYRIFAIDPATPPDYALFLARVHPDDRERVDAAWRAALDGSDYDVEHRILVAGETRWVRELGEFVRGADGRPQSALGTVQDITALKCIELELRHSEERYRSTIAAVEDGLWEWLVPADRIDWDARCFTMLGYAADAFTLNFERWRALLHPDDAAATIATVQAQLASGASFAVEFRYLRADGGWQWTQGRGKVVEWADGQPLRVVGTLTDIGARKAAEAALQAGHARLEAVIGQVHGAMLLEDGDGRIVLANATFCSLFLPATTPAQLAGERSDDCLTAASVTLPGGRAFIDRIAALRRAAQPLAGEEIVLADGRVLERDYTPVRSAAGLIGHLWTYRDITERKQRERELQRLASTDLLTGLPNRRAFLTRLEQEQARMQRFGSAGAVLMIDLDHFKRINDSYGHAAGDAALRLFAERAQACLRATDLLGRLGGEEFAALLPGTDAAGATLLAERLRTEIAAAPFPSPQGALTITVSVGVATLSGGDTRAEMALARADAALYRAKSCGRDRVEVDCVG